MKAVILAGGLGTRLKPFTDIIPKPLLPVGEYSVIEVQVQRLAQSGFKDIYIATNYKGDYIEAYLGNGSKYGVSISYSKEKKALGTCGPLSLLREELQSEPFLMINGDILTTADLGEFFRFAVAKPSLMTVATKIVTTPFRFGKVEVDLDDNIISIEEKPELMLEVIAGIYGCKPGLLDLIPDDMFIGMDSMINTLINDKSLGLTRYLIKDYWLDIGQVEDYEKARSEIDRYAIVC